MTVTGEHPFLTGVLAPVRDEIDVTDLPVTGEIPAAINGCYLRNGPNPAFEPGAGYHLFDGDGMVHGVWIADGKAHRYRNRWVDTAFLQAEHDHGGVVWGGMSEIATDPATADIRAAVGPVKNAANTHVVRHADKILCLWEVGAPHQLTPELDTVGAYDFDGALTSGMTAHPKEDPVTGDLVFFGYGVFPPYLTYYRADSSGKIVERAEIDLPAPVMMHDFVVTDRHVVFLDAPAVFDLDRVLAGGPAFAWEPERGTRFGVFDRIEGASSIKWFDTEPGYVFHFLNGFSDGGSVVIDGCRQERLAFGQTVEERAAPPVLPILNRWRIDLASGAVSRTQRTDQAADFPRMHDGLLGTDLDVGFLTGWSTPPTGEAATAFDTSIRWDQRSATIDAYHHGAGRVTCETVFVADPDRHGADDGWLMSYVYDLADDTSELVILDASSPSAGPVATVAMPRRVPMGFHGSWLPSQR